MAQDLIVRIDATAAGFSAALAKAEASTYKFETSLIGLNRAILALDAELATAGPAAMAAAARNVEREAAATVNATRKVGSALGIMGAAGAVAVYAIVRATAQFDEKIATVGALVRGTKGEMDGLRQAAMTAGHGIAVSASGAADAEIELAKAGIDAKDIIGGALRGALTLAAAGQADLADSTTVAAAAMTEFGLAGSDVPHIADLIAAGADRSLGSVTDLGYALAQAGTTAHQAGISFEETTATLAAFAAAGLIGERGGTTLKQVLLQLEAPTDKANALFKEFGLSLYDTNGQMKTMPEIAGSLNAAFGDLTPKIRNAALATIFGSRAVQGANILMALGVKGTQEWIDKVNVQGFAAQQARQKLDSLNGDLDKFVAAISNAAVAMGEANTGPLRDLVSTLTSLVEGFNGLPKPVQSSVLVMLGLVTAVGLVGGATLLLVAKFAKLRLAMASTEAEAVALRTTMLSTAASLGKVFAILAAADVASHGLNWLNSVDQSTQDLAKDLDVLASKGTIMPSLIGSTDMSINGQMQDLVDLMDLAREDAHTLVGTIDNMGRDSAAVNRIQAIDDALVQLSRTDPSAAEAAFMRLVHAGNLAGLSTEHAMGEFPHFLEVWTAGYKAIGRGANVVTANAHQMGTALSETGASSRILAGATDITTAAMAKQITTAKDLVAALDKLNSKNLDLRSTARDWQASIDAATAALKDNGKILGNNTERGRANNAALDAMASSAIAHAAAMQKSGRGITQVNDYLVTAHDRLVETARDFGMGKTKAETYADAVLKIPKTADTKVNLDDSEAIRKALAIPNIFNTALGKIDDEQVKVSLSAQALKVENTLARFTPHATGGPVTGGVPGKDSVYGVLMPGERVATTAVVNRAGGGNNQRGQKVMAAIERMILRGQMGKLGDVPAFAAGGPVAVIPDVSQSGVSSAANAVNSMFDATTAALSVALSKQLNKLLTQLSFGAGSPLGWAGSLTPAGIVRGQEFASSQAGKPYVWGAVGPGGYDCSGFQSAVLNSAHNAYPYRRLGSTGTMPWAGSAPGVGMYTIGWSTNVGGTGIGHTSGNIGGLGVESNGSDGVVVGSGALSPLDSMFNGLMHYDGGGRLRPGYTLAHNGTGADELVMRFAGGGGVPTIPPHHNPDMPTVAEIHDMLQAAFKHFYFGPNATADKTASEVHDLVQALREALGKDSPLLEHVKNLGDKLIQAAKAQDRMSEHLDALIAKRDEYASEVAGTFRNDLFGGNAESLLTQLKADRNDARRMHQALRKAKAKGLSGGLFKELAASGDYGTAQELAQMTPAQIHRYEVLYQQRQKATRTLGDYAGNQVFGEDIHGIRRELGHLNHQIRKLHQAINHIGPHVEHGARRGTHDGARDGMREQGRRAAHGIR